MDTDMILGRLWCSGIMPRTLQMLVNLQDTPYSRCVTVAVCTTAPLPKRNIPAREHRTLYRQDIVIRAKTISSQFKLLLPLWNGNEIFCIKSGIEGLGPTLPHVPYYSMFHVTLCATLPYVSHYLKCYICTPGYATLLTYPLLLPTSPSTPNIPYHLPISSLRRAISGPSPTPSYTYPQAKPWHRLHHLL